MCSAGASFLRLPLVSRSAASLRRTAASIVSLAACPTATAGKEPQRSARITNSLIMALLQSFNWLFDDLKAGLDFYLRSQRCRNATVFRFGEFDCMRHGFRRDRFAGEDVMHVHRRETPWIIIATHSGNFNDVARHVLPLLLENARHVGCGTRSERDQKQFNR